MKKHNADRIVLLSQLLILALSSCLSLLLTLNAGLLIVLSLTKLGQNAGLNALSLETTKRVVKSFIFFYSDFCHLKFPPFAVQRVNHIILLYYYIPLSIFCQGLFLTFFQKDFTIF